MQTSMRPWTYCAGAIATALPITIYTVAALHTGNSQWSRALYQLLILVGLLLAAPSVTMFIGLAVGAGNESLS